MFSTRTLIALSTVALATASASAVVIDFTLPGGTLITNQYPDATFSSDAGFGLYALNNFACTAPLNAGIDCVHNVFVDFTSPVSGITLLAIEPNEFGTVATFFLYNGNTLLGTQDLIGLAGSPNTFTSGNAFVDLTSFANVTRLEIRGPGGNGLIDSSYGGNGIGWDNLEFTVPAPGSLALVSAASVALLRRRRA